MLELSAQPTNGAAADAGRVAATNGPVQDGGKVLVGRSGRRFG